MAGKAYRDGISLIEIMRKFPDDATAEAWFIERRWPDGIHCPHCGSDNVQTGAKHKTMPYRCREKECAKRFSAKTGDRHGRIEAGLPGMDDRHLPANDQPQIGVQHEAAPGFENQSAQRVVPRPIGYGSR